MSGLEKTPEAMTSPNLEHPKLQFGINDVDFELKMQSSVRIWPPNSWAPGASWALYKPLRGRWHGCGRAVLRCRVALKDLIHLSVMLALAWTCPARTWLESDNTENKLF